MLKSWLRSWVRVSVLRKGLSGQSRFWLAVGALGALRKLQRRFAGKVETVVFGEQMKPGDKWLITYESPPSKRRRTR